MLNLNERTLRVLLTVCDIGILVLGGLAVWFLGYSNDDPWRRLAFVFGLSGQLFWFGKSILTRDYYLLGVTLLFTFSWLRGLINHP